MAPFTENIALAHLVPALGYRRVVPPVVRAILTFFREQGLDPRRIYARAAKARDPAWRPLPPYSIVAPDATPGPRSCLSERTANSTPPLGAANPHHKLRRGRRR